jgi:hypothetical protein
MKQISIFVELCALKVVRAISADTLGDSNAWNYLSLGLDISGPVLQNFPLQNINFDVIQQNNQTELVVTGTGTVWGQDQLAVNLVLYFNQQNNLGTITYR